MNTMKLQWTSIWGNAVSIAENRPESYSKNITLRYPIYSHFSGEAIRLTFDNYCGTEDITISKTTVFLSVYLLPSNTQSVVRFLQLSHKLIINF